MAEQSQESREESEDKDPALWRKFFIILTGKTNEAHQAVVKFFKSWGQTEVKSPEDADYCLVFCPVSSRVGVDVRDAIERLHAGKAAVLVVMHHTFNTEQVIPPSRRVATDRRVRLTLDCLFYQDKLLSCELNRNMETNIMDFFRFSLPETRDGKDPDCGGESGSKDHQDQNQRPPKDGNNKGSNTKAGWRAFLDTVTSSFTNSPKPKKNKTSENDNPESKAATCSDMETDPPAAPSGSEVISLEMIKELREEIEALKKHHVEEIEALKKQHVEEIEALKSEPAKEIAKRDQKLQTDLEKVKKHVGFPVDLHPHGGPVLTNSGGGPGSMYTQNTAPKHEDGAMNSSSEEDQAGPGEIPQHNQTSVEDEEKSDEKKETTPEKQDGQPVASAEPKSKGDSDPAESGGQLGSTD